MGDRVYLKLQPHIQSSVALRSNHKLSFRFYGPFEVLSRVGKVAYKLDLPTSTQIHPVVHVSQLKKHIPANEVLEFLDAVATDYPAALMPIQVLDGHYQAWRYSKRSSAHTVGQAPCLWLPGRIHKTYVVAIQQLGVKLLHKQGRMLGTG